MIRVGMAYGSEGEVLVRGAKAGNFSQPQWSRKKMLKAVKRTIRR
jgi:hypothetical protein